MPDSCAVYGCTKRRDRDGVTFFALPKVRQYHISLELIEISIKRQKAWIRALRRSDNGKQWKVCSDHFMSGTILARLVTRLRNILNVLD